MTTETETKQSIRQRWPLVFWSLRCLRWAGLAIVAVVLLGLTLWAATAICYADTHGPSPRYALACLYVLAVLGAVILLRRRGYKWAAPAVAFLLVLAWFLSLKPSNDREWASDVARLGWGEVHGDQLTLHNVRNFDYRSETDFTPRWEDRNYDLNRLRTVDVMLVYWGSKAIAHAMVSFDFDDGQYLCCSIETRKERGESYSALQGFFRQYELIYVFGDERDVVRVRTNYRNEDVYLYRTNITPEHARAALLSYLDSANRLREKPEWYNALTTNCATSVLPHARAAGAKAEMSWDIVLSGHAGHQAYRNGTIDTDLPYDELERRSRVNDVAVAIDRDPDFSNKIRAALPVPPAWAGVSRSGDDGSATPAAILRRP
jgi:hypothetical protein